MSTNNEFDNYANSYDEDVNTAMKGTGVDLDFATSFKAELLVDLISKHIGAPSSAKCLDLGCGVGLYEHLLRDKIGEIHGVDVSSKSVERARENNPDAFYKVYNGTKLPYSDGEFDVVFIITVMHHIPPKNWGNTLLEVKRVLREKGLCVIFEHNPYNPATRWIVSRCEFDEDAVLLSAQRSKTLLEEAGFTSIEKNSILTIPFKNPLSKPIDKVFSKLPFGAQYYCLGKA